MYFLMYFYGTFGVLVVVGTLQKMRHWEDWRKKRFQQKTDILKRELAKQQKALLDQA